MITWMQRHKKYLIITIWISTIAFVGAGFVGWGQYSYGDKAGAVAKVGTIEITMGDLQKGYSRLYSQYNRIFQGNFDEEKAKSFGLQKQALKQLIDQALILNLAASYDLQISDAELLADLTAQKTFFKDGVFNKSIYRETLNRNNLSLKEYEADVKKQLLIQKTIKLLPVQATTAEDNIQNVVLSIADKISYKVLDESQITIDTSDALLRPFWEMKQQNYMNEASYELRYIKHDTNATKKEALRAYIDYKKGKLSSDIPLQTVTITASTNPYGPEVMQKIAKLTLVAPFMKPILVNKVYHTFELVKINSAKAKSFEEAKAEVLVAFEMQQKTLKLQELAKNSYQTFRGTTTGFITAKDSKMLMNLQEYEANQFLEALFLEQKKKGYITIQNGKIILYHILEQKMLTNTQENDTFAKLKNTMFSDGLISSLQSKYKTEIFIEGL